MSGVEAGAGTARNWSVLAHATCAYPVPGLQRVGGSDGPGYTHAAATCPSDKELIGVGGELSGAPGKVTMAMVSDDFYGWNGLRQARVWGVVGGISPFPSFASVYAWGICAYPLPGREVVSARRSSDGVVADVRVTCPSGKKVLGGGAGILASDPSRVYGNVVIDDIVASSDLTQLRVVVYAGQNPPDAGWSAESRAICATA